MRPSHAQRTNVLVLPFVPRLIRSRPTPHSGGLSRTSNPSGVLFFYLALIFLLKFITYVVISYSGYLPMRGHVFPLSSHGGFGTSLFPTRRIC